MRVMLVDDHPAFLSAAAALLESAGFEVVSSVEDGESVPAAYAASVPDLVLVDVQLPGIDGVAVAWSLAALEAPPVVVLVSSREDAGGEPAVLAAPVLGFIAKRDLSPERLRALLP